MTDETVRIANDSCPDRSKAGEIAIVWETGWDQAVAMMILDGEFFPAQPAVLDKSIKTLA